MEGSAKTVVLASYIQRAELQRLKEQATSAAQQQALDQEIANIDYQQFMEEQNYQRSLLAYQSDILRGNASALGNTSTSYTPQPSLAQSLIGVGGAGLSALSLAQQFGGQQS